MSLSAYTGVQDSNTTGVASGTGIAHPSTSSTSTSTSTKY